MPKTENGKWREWTEQGLRGLMFSCLRTMTAWLQDHPDLPTVDTWEIGSGIATADLGRRYPRLPREKAEAMLESYAAALDSTVQHYAVSEHDGQPALVLEARLPLDAPHPNQRNVGIEMYFVIEEDEV